MVDGVGTTHQVRIGSEHYLVKPGTYRKRPAPMFGARFTTGDPDWNNLSSWQHWVQRTWIGGFDASEWQDEAMYDKAVGIDTSYHDVMLLSRDIGPNSDRATDNWDLDGNERPHEFFVWNGVDNSGTEGLYCLTHSGIGNTGYLHRWKQSTDEWVLVHTFTTTSVRCAVRWRNRIYFGDEGANMTIMAGNPGSESFSNVAKPAGVTAVPRAMAAYRDRLYVGFDEDIWRMKPDGSWDGSTVFYEAPGVNVITDMEEHLGFLYMASENGHILRTDGNNTFDMWQMESNIVVTGMRSFDGRLFIACRDPLEGTSDSEAVLYQFSGAAVTELKRFGKAGIELDLGKLRAVGGRLFFGAPSLMGFDDGFGLTMYDPVEDSYHIFTTTRNGSAYSAGTEQTKWNVDDVIHYRGYLWLVSRGHGVFRTRYEVRDIQDFRATYDISGSGASSGSKNGGWIESSEFDAGTPGLLKLWNAIIIDADLPTTDTSIFVEYSTDGGFTWDERGTITKTGTDTRYRRVFLLDRDNGGVEATTFKYRLTLRTTDQTRTPMVRGVIVRYLPIPEPNWVWDMTLVLSDTQELLDETIQTPNLATKLSVLETAFRQQNLVFFEDIDGTRWATNNNGNDLPGVLIQSLEERVPIISAASAGEVEREVNISLMEMIEEYENEVI